MNCPKHIERKLLQRANYAEKILSLNCEIDKWLLNNDIATEYMYSHCMIYTEPSICAEETLNDIKNKTL